MAPSAPSKAGRREHLARIAASHRWAVAGTILLLASVLLPWWRVTHGHIAGDPARSIRPFRQQAPLADAAATTATGALLVPAAAIVFLAGAVKARPHSNEYVD